MLDFARLEKQVLNEEPFHWAMVGQLFSPDDAAALASSFPRDHFKTVVGYDGEKGYKYRCRSLVHMGADAPSHREHLSPAWKQLADDLLSPAYREQVSVGLT